MDGINVSAFWSSVCAGMLRGIADMTRIAEYLTAIAAIGFVAAIVIGVLPS